jgi:hypothetical protein
MYYVVPHNTGNPMTTLFFKALYMGVSCTLILKMEVLGEKVQLTFEPLSYVSCSFSHIFIAVPT